MGVAVGITLSITVKCPPPELGGLFRIETCDGTLMEMSASAHPVSYG